MKAKGMILLAIIALIGVLGVNAQDIIPVDEVQKLNEVQKQMIKSVKKEIKSGIVLPIEVNYLSGDTAKKSHYIMKPIWEKGYFVDRDSAELIIPLQNDSINLLQCQMRWSEVEDKKYMLIVETILGNVDIEGLFSGSMVYSDYNGCFIRVYNFNKGECVEIVTNNIVGDMYFPKRKTKRNNNSNYKYTDNSKKILERTDKIVKPRDFKRDDVKNNKVSNLIKKI